jgi:hypothetical protein
MKGSVTSCMYGCMHFFVYICLFVVLGGGGSGVVNSVQLLEYRLDNRVSIPTIGHKITPSSQRRAGSNSIQLAVQWVMGIKRTEPYHSFQPREKFKNAWSCISTSLNGSIAWRLTNHRVKFILSSFRLGYICSPKRRLTFNGQHNVVSQKLVLFITTVVRTSNPTTYE